MVLGLLLGTSLTEVQASNVTFKVTNPEDGVKAVLSFTENGDKKIAIDATGNGTVEVNDFTPPGMSSYHTEGHAERFISTLPATFVGKERTRLKYFTYGFFPMHPMYYVYQTQDSTHVASDAFYDKLQSLVTIDENLLKLPEYKEFLLNAVASMSYKGVTEKVENTTEQFVNYIDANIKDAKVAEYLVNLFVYGNVSSRGLDGTDALIAMFNKHVKEAAMVEKFNALCGKWEKLKAGVPSPTFSCLDINGKTVSLADLKGKFVYIDVWATRCGPCRGELPHLKTLEEKYADKDIYFVSLSCDKNKKAWEDMVKKDEMKGIQLHLGVESPFMNAYLINGIPRFILLDRNGDIISANMPRPSDP